MSADHCRKTEEGGLLVSTMMDIDEPEISERSKVESWRMHVLVEAGYSLHAAELLAGSDADLHRAVDLVHDGCPYETAAKILL